MTLMRYWRAATGGGTPRRAAVTALAVGPILTLINQGDALFAGQGLDWLKVILTFLVPYCVATYGAMGARLQLLSEAPEE